MTIPLFGDDADMKPYHQGSHDGYEAMWKVMLRNERKYTLEGRLYKKYLETEEEYIKRIHPECTETDKEYREGFAYGVATSYRTEFQLFYPRAPERAKEIDRIVKQIYNQSG